MACPDLLEWYDTQIANGCISSAKWNAMVRYLKDKILNKDLAAPTATEDTKAITWNESGDAFGYTAIPSDLSDLSGDSDNVSEGSTNLFFTDERAQDAVGTILTDTTEIDFTYTDATPSITADLKTTAVTAGDYTYTALTVDSKGRITAASSGTSPIVYNDGEGIDIDESYNVNVNLAETSGLEFDTSLLKVTVDGSTIQIGASGIEVIDNSITNAKMADDAVGLAELSATGTPSETTYLRGDNTWASMEGSGDVTGDTSSTDNAIATFNGITGKAIQNTLVTIDDLGSVNIPTGQSYKINDTALAASDVSAIPTSSAPSGTIVGTTDEQTLTTKTIDADSNTISNIGSSEIKSEIITGLTELEETAADTDVLMLYDTSGTALKKLQISNLPSSGGGTGDVVGPASAVDDRIATFDGITGKLIQDGGKTIAELADLNTGQTLTNKIINGDDNTLSDIAYSSIKSTSRSGSDVTLITGTKGTSGNLSQWNVDGDLVDSKTPPSGDIVGTTDTQTLTTKIIDADSNTITNIGASEVKADLIIGQTELEESAATTDFVLLYDTSGTALKKLLVSNLPTGSGDITTDGAWVAKGDLIAGTGTDAASILSVGTNGYVLSADSTQTTGLNWVAASSGGSSNWTEITDFTTTPASTSTITTTSDLTGSIAIRTPLKYVIGGMTYYGIVTAHTFDTTTGTITIAGAPLSSTITSLYYGDISRVKTDKIVVNGYYANDNDTTLLESDLFMKNGYPWVDAKAYLVTVGYIHAAGDGTLDPVINFVVNGSDLLTSDVTVSTTQGKSIVNITPANYDINFGEHIEIDVTKGTAGDAHDLTVYYVAVYP